MVRERGEGLERLFSADSHVVEPADLYSSRAPAGQVDRMPHVVSDGDHERWVFPGSDLVVKLGLVASAGREPDEIESDGRIADVDAAAYDAAARLVAQDRDGVCGEVLYPTVGLLALQHPDLEVRRLCCAAYNDWLAQWCAHASDRLIGVGMSAATSPAETVRDVEHIASLGLRGVLLPAEPPPGVEYDDPSYDEVWQRAAGGRLPIAFHVHTVPLAAQRGSALGVYVSMIRSCQDVLGVLVFGGVFERHPTLRVVLVESDAGWLPHMVQRMDHAWHRYGNVLGGRELPAAPSVYVGRSVYATFQDDEFALRSLHSLDPGRLLWGSDYPHVDSTWPRSRRLLQERMASIDAETRRRIVYDNAWSLFGRD